MTPKNNVTLLTLISMKKFLCSITLAVAAMVSTPLVNAGQLPASDPVAFTTDTAARQNVVIIVETPTEIIIIL